MCYDAVIADLDLGKVTALPDDDLITLEVAAGRLNVSQQFLTRLVEQGQLSLGTEGVGLVRASEVALCNNRIDRRRGRSLDRLVELSEEMQGYKLGK